MYVFYKKIHENRRLFAQQRINMALKRGLTHYLPHLGLKALENLINGYYYYR